jgi:peptidyl-dipeptidase A
MFFRRPDRSHSSAVHPKTMANLGSPPGAGTSCLRAHSSPSGRARPAASIVAVAALLLLSACGDIGEPRSAAGPAGAPTAEEAEEFVARAEEQLERLAVEAERAAWVQSNFITLDTELIASAAYEKLLAATADLAGESARFDGLDLPYELARKLLLLKVSLPLAAPPDPAKQKELAELATGLEAMYGKGKYCPAGPDGECLDLNRLERIIAESRNPDELLDAWRGWRTISPPMKPMYARFVELGNEGARRLGFADLGALWRSGYDMHPDEFAAESDRLWEQVRPLYEALHCHVRAALTEFYGARVVPADGAIPAHLLGNMWAQNWSYIYDLVAPAAGDSGYDLTDLLKRDELDALGMVRYGEQFFTSLGFKPLPATFWERSLFTKPADREVVCHASAWDVDADEDLRIKMCIEVDAEDFSVIHHELGHNFYQRAYRDQSYLHREGAHDGFHEGVGDAVALSITPEYLVKLGLLDKAPGPEGDLGFLLRKSMDKVAYLPFGLIVDQWRWKVFAGDVTPETYNDAWWELRETYQGIGSPIPRKAGDFDPGAKYHIPANTPYSRYFLAAILQFQFQRALCDAAGYEGPLHRCSVYANDEAGRRMREMLAMGRSQPWPEALEALTGSRQMDAAAILDYFAPLKEWLDEQNAGRSCGW